MVSFMQVASIIITAEITMNIRWGLNDWVVLECDVQYSSEFMDAEVFAFGYKYDLHFEKGRNVGGLKKEETKQKKDRYKRHWRPDLEVFTDIKN